MTGVQTCALPICFPVTIVGGSGEIVVNMEKRIVELGKKVVMHKDEIEVVRDKNSQLEQKVSQVLADLKHVKHMNDLKEAALNSDIQHMKQMQAMKDVAQKGEMNLMKSKTSNDIFGTWVRNITAAIGLGTTVYKLLC